VIDREPAPIDVLLLWGVCHVEWLSEGWYICHNKQIQLWHITFATKVTSYFSNYFIRDYISLNVINNTYFRI
jgi:hypothetical protein